MVSGSRWEAYGGGTVNLWLGLYTRNGPMADCWYSGLSDEIRGKRVKTGVWSAGESVACVRGRVGCVRVSVARVRGLVA